MQISARKAPQSSDFGSAGRAREGVVFSCPVGLLGISAIEGAIDRIELNAEGPATSIPSSGVIADAIEQLIEYFAGQRRTFTVPLAPSGTPFQQSVWRALLEIPYGATWSYTALAQHVGRPAAVRAVGAANGQNPIPIIIPCHRVIGANGKLVGFGGGIDMKRRLLEIEGGFRDLGI